MATCTSAAAGQPDDSACQTSSAKLSTPKPPNSLEHKMLCAGAVEDWCPMLDHAAPSSVHTHCAALWHCGMPCSALWHAMLAKQSTDQYAGCQLSSRHHQTASVHG